MRRRRHDSWHSGRSLREDCTQAINMIISGEIIDYQYDASTKEIIERRAR